MLRCQRLRPLYPQKRTFVGARTEGTQKADSLAAAQGDDESAEIHDKIATGMTPDQIAEA